MLLIEVFFERRDFQTTLRESDMYSEGRNHDQARVYRLDLRRSIQNTWHYLKRIILVYPSGNYGPFLMVTRIFMIYGIVFKKDSISSIQNDNFVENF